MSTGQGLPRIATIATMPGRVATFQKVLDAIHPQVDHTFVYLDGFEQPPAFLGRYANLSLRRAEKLGDLHASSRFLCLAELRRPAHVFSIDDDIAFPRDYVKVLGAVLGRVNGKALVGVHGRLFLPPHVSYVKDAAAFHFANELKRARHAHELGCGTLAFLSTALRIDPRDWSRHDMDDIMVAIEAQRRGLPRIAIARPRGWLKPYAQNQQDSLWLRAQQDDSAQSAAMRTLLGLYAGPRTGGTHAKPSREAPDIPMPE